MTRTRPLHLVLLAIAGAGVSWLTQTALAASGRAVLIPPFTIAVALVLIGALVVVMALPVRRVAKRIPDARVDPFYATRVVTLAKASSLSGALLGGLGLGVILYLLSRSVLPPVGSVTMSLAMTIGAVALVVAGLVAEAMCAIPPSDDDKPDRPALGARPDRGGPA